MIYWYACFSRTLFASPILTNSLSIVADAAVNDLLNQYWRELSTDLFHEMSDELLEISKIIINIILGVFPVNAVVTP